MATDLDVSTATFGTASLLLASGDPITDDTGSAWSGQVAQNTGWLYYQPRPIYSYRCPAITARTSETYSMGYTYCPAGTYSIYGHGLFDKTDAINGQVLWDGTALVAFAGTTAATGSLCGWSTTARWVQTTVTGSADSAAAVITSAASMRFGSYAP